MTKLSFNIELYTYTIHRQNEWFFISLFIIIQSNKKNVWLQTDSYQFHTIGFIRILL